MRDVRVYRGRQLAVKQAAQVLTVAQAAQVLGITQTAMWKRLKRGLTHVQGGMAFACLF